MKKALILLMLTLLIIGCTQKILYTQNLADELEENNKSLEAEISEVEEVVSINN